MNHTKLQLGQAAYNALQKAVETGETTDFLRLMKDDVTFYVPLPFEEWRGEQRGKARLRELLTFERETMQLRIKFLQTGIAATENLVAVEFTVEGANKGGAYKNHLAIFFEIEDGLVKSWREYGGDIDPQAVAAIAR